MVSALVHEKPTAPSAQLDLDIRLSKVVNLFKPRHLKEAVQSGRTKAITEMVSTLASFAEADAKASLNMVIAGEIYYNLLKQKPTVFREFIETYCTRTGQETPAFPEDLEKRGRGRPEKGRNILAKVIYGKYPELLDIPEGRKDSKAGQRITACLRSYKQSAGLANKPHSQGLPRHESIPSNAGKFFLALWNVATTEREHGLLLMLCERCEFDSKTIKAWVNAAKDEEVIEIAAS